MEIYFEFAVPQRMKALSMQLMDVVDWELVMVLQKLSLVEGMVI